MQFPSSSHHNVWFSYQDGSTTQLLTWRLITIRLSALPSRCLRQDVCSFARPSQLQLALAIRLLAAERSVAAVLPGPSVRRATTRAAPVQHSCTIPGLWSNISWFISRFVSSLQTQAEATPLTDIARAGPFQAQSTLYSNGQTIANQCEQACADFVPSMHQRQTPVYSQQQLQRVHLGQSYPRTQMPQPVMQGGPISGVSGSFQQHALVHEAYPATAQQAQPLYPDTEYVGSTADDSLAQQPRSPSASLILVTAESIARDMQANGQTPPVQRSYSSHNQPGPCKASDVQRYWDGNEVPWIRFEYNQKHVPETVNIRIDIEDMSVDHIPEDFKRKNCCYPGAHGLPRKKSTREPKPPRSANHPHTLYEKDCNIRGWKLAWKNPGVLCGKPGKLQRAEQSYCNATGRESRRVRKQRRRADATKKAEAQHHAPMQQQMLLHVDSWTQEQNQAMPRKSSCETTPIGVI